MAVRSVTPADAADWLALRCALWPDGTAAEHRDEIAAYLAGRFPRWPWIALLAVDDDGAPIGMAELSIRPYAEGCATCRVAYLEGWYVVPSQRGRGVGAALVRAGEDWARQQGCTELASDADPDNALSLRAHVRVGFEEVGLVRCFRKDLPSPS